MKTGEKWLKDLLTCRSDENIYSPVEVMTEDTHLSELMKWSIHLGLVMKESTYLREVMHQALKYLLIDRADKNGHLN